MSVLEELGELATCVIPAVWSFGPTSTRYVAVVTGREGGTPLAFCGHLHRRRAAAEHCESGLVEGYREWLRLLERLRALNEAAGS